MGNTYLLMDISEEGVTSNYHILMNNRANFDE